MGLTTLQLKQFIEHGRDVKKFPNIVPIDSLDKIVAGTTILVFNVPGRTVQLYQTIELLTFPAYKEGEDWVVQINSPSFSLWRNANGSGTLEEGIMGKSRSNAKIYQSTADNGNLYLVKD